MQHDCRLLLEEMGSRITTTVNQLDDQAQAWDKSLESQQEALSTFIDSANQFSTVVDEIEASN